MHNKRTGEGIFPRRFFWLIPEKYLATDYVSHWIVMGANGEMYLMRASMVLPPSWPVTWLNKATAPERGL